MKFKTFISLIIIVLAIFIIYIFTRDNKIYYINFMDTNIEDKMYMDYLKEEIEAKGKLEYYDSYYTRDYRTTDFIRDINDNIKINNKNIQNLLIKADVITIMIGNNELHYKIKQTEMIELYDYSDSLLNDIENLFKLIRKYCKEKIFFIGFYNDDSEEYDELYSYINLKLEDLCNEYNIVFIDSNNVFDNNQNINIYKKISKNVSM